MKVIGIEHIGIVVKDLEKNASFWKNIIGLKHCGVEDVDGQGVLTDIYDTGSGKIELLVSKYPNSPISKFIKKRGKIQPITKDDKKNLNFKKSKKVNTGM